MVGGNSLFELTVEPQSHKGYGDGQRLKRELCCTNAFCKLRRLRAVGIVETARRASSTIASDPSMNIAAETHSDAAGHFAGVNAATKPPSHQRLRIWRCELRRRFDS
ncbi:MAG: hypothetical protein Q8N13_03755 [Acidovorax sp.]|nr:hypothetical protein [Acidovorax sp.]